MSFAKTLDQENELLKVGFLADSFSKRAKQIDESGEFPHQNIRDLIKAGYTTLTLGTEFNGKEISLYELLLYQERLARGCGSTALAIGWHLGIIMDLHEKRPWDKHLFNDIMFEVSKGALLNRAASEPHTGSPTRGGRPQTSAKKEGDKWCINGRKTFTTMAKALDIFLVTASIEGESDIGEFLIRRDIKGVEIKQNWDTISMRGTGSHDLVLNNVKVDDKFLVEVKSPQKESNGWLLHIPACYLGIAQAARNYAVQFSKTYSPNSLSGPIMDLPNVQRLIGKMEIELMQARHFLFSVAEKWDNYDNRNEMSAELAAAKYVATNTAVSVVDYAMRIVGSKSLFKDNPLQRYYRDVRAGLHNPPMDDMTISLLAKKALE